MTDKLKFKIGLSGTYSGDKTPEYKIAVNGHEYVHGTIKTASGVTEFFEFEADLPDGDCSLDISLLNKTNSDVIKDNYNDPDNFKIIGDLLLNIDSIEIDDIDIGNLKYTASKYQPFDGRDLVKNCVNLGWNGTYSVGFTTPFYIWLLENL
jgi:hypothetical protein